MLKRLSADEMRRLSLKELLSVGSFDCECGHRHELDDITVLIESGATRKIPALLREKGCRRPFILSGHDSFAAAGQAVLSVLDDAGIEYSRFVLPGSPVEPTEYTVGSVMMHYDFSCDSIVSIGSGVINDTGKFLAASTGHEYFIVATAPSMDGFASATSSMERNGLKVSIPTAYAHTVIGDLDILCNAPMHMLCSGVGDMLAKYISLVEWKISSIITGEYYCPVIAALVENALAKVIAAAPALRERDRDAVAAVMEGMVIAGLGMNYAGVSRPASGMEHYFSHIWDMRSLAFKDAGHDLHGIQCGIATLICLKVWDYIRTVTPNREKALEAVSRFSVEDWFENLRSFIGPGAESMIAGELREHKYDADKHASRLERIIDRWEDILAAASALPSADELRELMEAIGAPTSAACLGYTQEQLALCLAMTKDIRDKYIGSRLLWDLGITDECAAAVFGV